MNKELYRTLEYLKDNNKQEYLRLLTSYKESDPEFYKEFISKIRKEETHKSSVKEPAKKVKLPDMSLIIVFFGLIALIIMFIIALFVLT